MVCYYVKCVLYVLFQIIMNKVIGLVVVTVLLGGGLYYYSYSDSKSKNVDNTDSSSYQQVDDAQLNSNTTVNSGVTGTFQFNPNQLPSGARACLEDELGSEFLALAEQGPVEITANDRTVFEMCLAPFVQN